ncbi:MAG TPA: hypothetical protein VF120_12545 [Ktedonobacterales bacterium]
MQTKIAVIGGSGTSTPRFVETVQRALSRSDRDSGDTGGVRVVLIGRHRDKLASVARICQKLAPAVNVTWDDTLERGVEGATVILNQIRVGGLEGRAWDEQAPTSIGLIGEETMGAGGFALGYRTLPVIRSLARVIEQHAPDAWLVNLSNPAGLVVATLAAETRLRALSVCDIPVTLERTLRTVAGSNNTRLQEIRVFGTNHVSAVISARDVAGHEVLPTLLPLVAASSRGQPFDATTLTAFGFLPSPYLRFIVYPEAYAPTAPLRHTRADDLLVLRDELDATYASGEVDHANALLSARNPHWYEEVVVPVIASLLCWGAGDTTPGTAAAGAKRRFVVQIPNRGQVPFLGEHAAIETSVSISDGTIAPLDLPVIPPEIKRLTVQLAEAEELVRLATCENSADLAIRALALNPLVPSLTKAREFWRLFSAKWLDR